MKLSTLFWGSLAAGAGALLYGALVEADRLTITRRRLRLAHWPRRLGGFRIAFLADFHLRDESSLRLAERAVAAALDSSPDMVVLGGDFVGRWTEANIDRIGQALEPLLLMNGSVVAVPGNRDYLEGDPDLLEPLLSELNIKLLRNQAWHHAGVNWVGIDSANAGQADPIAAMAEVEGTDPAVAVWHEPDLVGWLPEGAALMLSGHSHGGQFCLPGGWAPMKSLNGSRYLQGLYQSTPTPLFVTRGIGTTGPPSRLFCPPEVAILDLEPLG